MMYIADHNGFYLNDAPFYPKVQDQPRPLVEWSNTVCIVLPAQLSDDLDWSSQIAQAKEVAFFGKAILWEIDLGLADHQFNPNDAASFYSYSLAVEEFSKKVWPLFQAETFGVVLYRGAFRPSHNFPVSLWEPSFLEWLSGQPKEDAYSLYCAQALSEYLHRLVSFLPDAVLPFALIDVSEIGSPTRIAQLFSKERFEHIHLGLKGANIPFSGICWEEERQGWFCNEGAKQPSIGIYLPKDHYLGPALLEKLDTLISHLNEKQKAFRIVSEEKLTEQWDGLDHLIAPSCSISAQGKRKLLGFIAAGGTIWSYADPIGLPEETTLETFTELESFDF